MEFASELTRIWFQDLGFPGLPPSFLWKKENSKLLANNIIEYISDNLSNKHIWIKFEFILEAIFQDDDFYKDFVESLAEYTGSLHFAQNLLKRAKNKEIMWSNECVVLFDRIEGLHNKNINQGDGFL